MTYRVNPTSVTFRIGGRDLDVDADRATLVVLGDHHARDARRAYFDGVSIAGADPATFVVLGPTHARDASSVFWRSRVLDGADPSTFRALGIDVGCDRAAVFDGPRVIVGADPSSFEVLDAEYARDVNHVYRNAQVVPDIAPTEFGIWDAFTRIGDRCTHAGSAIAADPASFRGLGGDYARDATHVFFRAREVATADVESFASLGVAFGRDRERTYLGSDGYDGEVVESWLGLSFEECRLRIRARSGDTKAMLAIARAMIARGDGFDAVVWLSAAKALGAKATAALREAWQAVDPHDEGIELRALAPYRAAELFLAGRELPRDTELAARLAGEARAAGLLDTTTITRAELERFGEPTPGGAARKRPRR